MEITIEWMLEVEVFCISVGAKFQYQQNYIWKLSQVIKD